MAQVYKQLRRIILELTIIGLIFQPLQPIMALQLPRSIQSISDSVVAAPKKDAAPLPSPLNAWDAVPKRPDQASNPGTPDAIAKQQIAYEANNVIYVQNTDGSNVHAVVRGWEPALSPDG